MKKILVVLLLLISSSCIGQKKTDSLTIVDSISKLINKKVTFVGWYVERDSIKITQITIYDEKKKTYQHLYISDLKKEYPILENLGTTKIQLPLSGSDWRYVDYINSIFPLNLKNWTNFEYRRWDT